jgi:Spy/CpxP family protein refolding chaperone
MMNKKTLILSSVLTLTLATGGILFAFGPHRHGDMIHEFIEFKIDRMISELNLSEEQQAKTDVIRKNIRQEIQSLIEQKKNSHQEFFNQLKQDVPDKESVYTMIDQNVENMRERSYAIADLFLEFHETLTAEQRDLLFQKIEEMHTEKNKPHRWHK